MNNPLPIIGLTGLTGSGKTTVSALLKAHGGFCINSDKLAHDVIKKGNPAYDAVLNAFGQYIIGPDDEIDRRKLGEAVFKDKDKMKLLESIIHPCVKEKTWEIVNQATAQRKYDFVVIDAPLLIEAGMHAQCDSVWLVTAPEALRKSRVIQRDALTEVEAAKRLSSRNCEEILLPHARVVVTNDGDITRLAHNVQEILERHGYV